MSANIRVSYHEIEQAASRLGQGREDITAKLQALQQQVQGLVSSGFVTEVASIKFDNAYREYTASTHTVIAKLNEIQGFLMQTAHAVREMDQQLAARIS